MGDCLLEGNNRIAVTCVKEEKFLNVIHLEYHGETGLNLVLFLMEYKVPAYQQIYLIKEEKRHWTQILPLRFHIVFLCCSSKWIEIETLKFIIICDTYKFVQLNQNAFS